MQLIYQYLHPLIKLGYYLYHTISSIRFATS
nr:MAG TPA: hypothetical protein [Caudoviricetes sp.]